MYQASSAKRTMATTPPTTPPAMAPTGVDDFGDEVQVGVVEVRLNDVALELELDVAEPVTELSIPASAHSSPTRPIFSLTNSNPHYS
jgi:hypothetical protein